MTTTTTMRDVAFVVTVYTEGRHQLDWCMSHLRAVYPDAPVCVISDGHDLPDYRQVCRQHAAEYVAGERLKAIGHGGNWWRRFFAKAWELRADHVFKFDPDALIVRPFDYFPDDLDVFGTLLTAGFIQGGVQGFKRRVVNRIVASGVLAELDDHRWVVNDDVKAYVTERREVSTDYQLWHVCRRLRLAYGDWPEVHSLWTQRASYRPGVAASHPHKIDKGEQWAIASTASSASTTTLN